MGPVPLGVHSDIRRSSLVYRRTHRILHRVLSLDVHPRPQESIAADISWDSVRDVRPVVSFQQRPLLQVRPMLRSRNGMVCLQGIRLEHYTRMDPGAAVPGDNSIAALQRPLPERSHGLHHDIDVRRARKCDGCGIPCS